MTSQAEKHFRGDQRRPPAAVQGDVFAVPQSQAPNPEPSGKHDCPPEHAAGPTHAWVAPGTHVRTAGPSAIGGALAGRGAPVSATAPLAAGAAPGFADALADATAAAAISDCPATASPIGS